MGSPIRTRRLGVVAALAAAALPLAGCGSGTHARTHAATAARGGRGEGATGSSRSASPSKKQAQAYVKAVNLRAGDLPGFEGSASKEHQSAAQRQLSAGLKRCLGAGSGAPGAAGAAAGVAAGAKGSGTLAEGGSEEYERKGSAGIAFAQSQVSVSASAAGAALKAAALRSSRVRHCLQSYLNLLLRHERQSGVRMGSVSVGSVTPPAPGAAGGFGWKLTVPLRAHGISLPLRMEIIGFVYGPAQVTLMTGALPLPFPGSAERSLYMLLLGRAESQHI